MSVYGLLDTCEKEIETLKALALKYQKNIESKDREIATLREKNKKCGERFKASRVLSAKRLERLNAAEDKLFSLTQSFKMPINKPLERGEE